MEIAVKKLTKDENSEKFCKKYNLSNDYTITRIFFIIIFSPSNPVSGRKRGLILYDNRLQESERTRLFSYNQASFILSQSLLKKVPDVQLQ
jgi:hypothetical protein